MVAVRLGADALGFVFHPASPRALDADQAARIAHELPPFVTTVGLFVDPAPERVETVLATVSLDLLQFHGDEPPELCRRFGRPYLKAIRMRDGIDLATEAVRYADAAGLLLDTWSQSAHGGTGEPFDWSRVPANLDKPIVLAGGLDPHNVAEAIRRTRPYAVDVSSGVEREKGIKDPDKMAAFMAAVQTTRAQ